MSTMVIPANVSSDYVSQLKNKIRDIENRIANLSLERNVLGAQLSQAVSKYAPIGALPSELLAHIFMLAVCTDSPGSGTLESIVRVCRHFRRVAFTTALLWTAVRVTTECKWDLVRLHFELSKSLPLDVSVHFDDFPLRLPPDAVGEALMDAMDVLEPCMDRFRTLRLYMYNETLAYAALSRCRSPAPMLERFTVRVHLPGSHAIGPQLRPFSGKHPRLQALVLQSLSFSGDVPAPSLLRSFHLAGYRTHHGPPLSVLVALFQACPRLESVHLEDMHDLFHQPDDRPSISMPRLSALILNNSGILRAQFLLKLLSCPVLSRLELIGLGEISALLRDLDPKADTMPLITLRLESALFNELRLMHMFMKWPAIGTLELVDCEDVSDNLLRGLSAPPAAQDWILPRLKHVSLEGCSSLRENELLGLVASRMAVGEPKEPNPLLPCALQSLDITRLSVCNETRAWLRRSVPSLVG